MLRRSRPTRPKRKTNEHEDHRPIRFKEHRFDIVTNVVVGSCDNLVRSRHMRCVTGEPTLICRSLEDIVASLSAHAVPLHRAAL